MDINLQYWHCLVFAMILIMAEIFVPSFTIFWFGLGGLVVAGLMLLFSGIGFSWQLFIWAIPSCTFTFLWFRFIRPISGPQPVWPKIHQNRSLLHLVRWRHIPIPEAGQAALYALQQSRYHAYGWRFCRCGDGDGRSPGVSDPAGCCDYKAWLVSMKKRFITLRKALKPITVGYLKDASGSDPIARCKAPIDKDDDV